MINKSDEYLYDLLKEAGEDITGYTIYKKRQKAISNN
jgi:hypothetical protein